MGKPNEYLFSDVVTDCWSSPGPGRLPLNAGRRGIESSSVFAPEVSLFSMSCPNSYFGILSKKCFNVCTIKHGLPEKKQSGANLASPIWHQSRIQANLAFGQKKTSNLEMTNAASLPLGVLCPIGPNLTKHSNARLPIPIWGNLAI